MDVRVFLHLRIMLRTKCNEFSIMLDKKFFVDPNKPRTYDFSPVASTGTAPLNNIQPGIAPPPPYNFNFQPQQQPMMMPLSNSYPGQPNAFGNTGSSVFIQQPSPISETKN